VVRTGAESVYVEVLAVPSHRPPSPPAVSG